MRRSRRHCCPGFAFLVKDRDGRSLPRAQALRAACTHALRTARSFATTRRKAPCVEPLPRSRAERGTRAGRGRLLCKGALGTQKQLKPNVSNEYAATDERTGTRWERRGERKNRKHRGSRTEARGVVDAWAKGGRGGPRCPHSRPRRLRTPRVGIPLQCTSRVSGRTHMQQAHLMGNERRGD